MQAFLYHYVLRPPKDLSLHKYAGEYCTTVLQEMTLIFALLTRVKFQWRPLELLIITEVFT